MSRQSKDNITEYKFPEDRPTKIRELKDFVEVKELTGEETKKFDVETKLGVLKRKIPLRNLPSDPTIYFVKTYGTSESEIKDFEYTLLKLAFHQACYPQQPKVEGYSDKDQRYLLIEYIQDNFFPDIKNEKELAALYDPKKPYHLEQLGQMMSHTRLMEDVNIHKRHIRLIKPKTPEKCKFFCCCSTSESQNLRLLYLNFHPAFKDEKLTLTDGTPFVKGRQNSFHLPAGINDFLGRLEKNKFYCMGYYRDMLYHLLWPEELMGLFIWHVIEDPENQKEAYRKLMIIKKQIFDTGKTLTLGVSEAPILEAGAGSDSVIYLSFTQYICAIHPNYSNVFQHCYDFINNISQCYPIEGCNLLEAYGKTKEQFIKEIEIRFQNLQKKFKTFLPKKEKSQRIPVFSLPNQVPIVAGETKPEKIKKEEITQNFKPSLLTQHNNAASDELPNYYNNTDYLYRSGKGNNSETPAPSITNTK